MKQKVNQLLNDVWQMEYLYVEPCFFKAHIMTAMKFIEKCRSFCYDVQQQFADDFSRVYDAKNGGRIIREVGVLADVAE